MLLQHVIANLIDNALRHARHRVLLCATYDIENIVLQVSDDGPGFPENERQGIFDRFVRIEGSDHTQGSGLGLAIVKRFGEAMGITVTVDSAPTGGARFTLAMPHIVQAGL